MKSLQAGKSQNKRRHHLVALEVKVQLQVAQILKANVLSKRTNASFSTEKVESLPFQAANDPGHLPIIAVRKKGMLRTDSRKLA